MEMEIVTKNDLKNFRLKLIADIERLLKENVQKGEEKLEGYKTADARRILNCSVNKLVSLRVARKIRTKKIGGTVYYNKADIKILLEEGY